MKKKCPRCNSEFPDSAIFCPLDGKELVDKIDELIGLNLDGKYFLEEFIGQDNYGRVYLAKNKDEQNLVVKVLHPHFICEQATLDRFRRNLKKALSINHPNIQKVLDGGVTGNNRGHITYFVSEIETGYPLADILTHTQAKFSLLQISALLKPICETLFYLHQQNILYKSLCPENIFIIKKLSNTSIKLALSIKVTPHIDYMSPEICQGLRDEDIDSRSDIYSLGILLYKLFTGNIPFNSESNIRKLMHHIQTKPKPFKDLNINVPPNIEQAIFKALEKSPRGRYNSTMELLEIFLSEAEAETENNQDIHNDVPNEKFIEVEQINVKTLEQSLEQNTQNWFSLRSITNYFFGTKETPNPTAQAPTDKQVVLPTPSQWPEKSLQKIKLREGYEPEKVIFLGSCFAFVDKQYLQTQDEKTLEYYATDKSIITPLTSNGTVNVAGYSLIGHRLQQLPTLYSLISDRQLYHTGKDIVTLVAAIIGNSASTIEVELFYKDQLYSTIFMEMITANDNSKLGIIRVYDLPSGEYTAKIKSIEAQISFTVAEYQLAPLNVTYKSQSYDNEEFSFTVKLESYEVPLVGTLRVELIEKEKVVDQQIISSNEEGYLSHSFLLEGDGPFNINFISLSDAAKTATLPIVGSRLQERTNLVVGQLGKIIEASLLPLPNAVKTRGFYLQTKEKLQAPVSLESPIGAEAKLICWQDLEQIKICLINPINKNVKEQDFFNVKVGQKLKIPIPKPYTIITLGTFIKGEPWESWSVVFHPSELKLAVDLPVQAEPSQEIRVSLKTNKDKKTVSVFLLVKDRRLIVTDSLESTLAGKIKHNISINTENLSFGRPTETWNSLYNFLFAPKIKNLGNLPESILVSHIGIGNHNKDANITNAGTATSGEYSSIKNTNLSEKTSRRAGKLGNNDQNLPPSNQNPIFTDEGEMLIRKDFPEVIYAEIVMIKGQGDISIKLGDAITEYSVEAFALDGWDWQTYEQNLNVSKNLFAEINAPTFVYQKDEVSASVSIGSLSGAFTLSITNNGENVPLKLNNEVLAINQAIYKKSAEVSFALKPGLLRVEARDLKTGQLDISERIINEPAHIQYLSYRPALLEAGQSIKINEEIKSFKLLFSLEKSFFEMAEATARYEHLCCEQTAAKIVANIFIFLLSKNDTERRKAEEAIIAGIKREKSMWLPSRGFKSYPASDDSVSYWSKGACEHLLNLRLLKKQALERPQSQLNQALAEGLKILDDVSKAHNLSLIPSSISSMEDAYRVAKQQKSRLTEALDYVRKQISWHKNTPNKSKREYCFAGATLLMSNSSEDIKQVAMISNWIMSQITANFMLYSTYETTAALILFSELNLSNIFSQKPLLKINNSKVLSPVQINNLKEPIWSIEAVEGRVLLEVTKLETESWDNLAQNVPISISFSKDNQLVRDNLFHLAESFDLKIRLDKGYQEGDLVQVRLPACLSRLVGGGQVKQFEVDFQGQNEVTVPLVATSTTLSPISNEIVNQYWAIALRNMYDENRATSLTDLRVKVLSAM